MKRCLTILISWIFLPISLLFFNYLSFKTLLDNYILTSMNILLKKVPKTSKRLFDLGSIVKSPLCTLKRYPFLPPRGARQCPRNEHFLVIYKATVPTPIKDATCIQKIFIQSTSLVCFNRFCAHKHSNVRQKNDYNTPVFGNFIYEAVIQERPLLARIR